MSHSQRPTEFIENGSVGVMLGVRYDSLGGSYINEIYSVHKELDLPYESGEVLGERSPIWKQSHPRPLVTITGRRYSKDDDLIPALNLHDA